MALMGDPPDITDEDAPASGRCQGCGAREAQHGSYLFDAGQQRRVLLLLCDECHRARLGLV
jgi:hypothetical protein